MEKQDLTFMKEAIEWASDCHPAKESIPKVGAVLAVDGKAVGRGRRGTGKEGDDRHAELNAILQVKDTSKLAQATLYTTLEPCSREVRSKPLECCTELIKQHQIQKVFVGTLDPNQGVTGKGLLRLQEAGVEVVLFPHDLSKEIRAMNAAFIRSQQTLCATIVSPTDGEELRTYDSHGKHPVRFKCKNPPGPNTYLFIYTGGSYWPQPGPFREIERGLWEIDAHFGSTGDCALQLLTAGDLGDALVRYYRKVVQQNKDRRIRFKQKLGGQIDLQILGGDYPGIEMNGLPKGLLIEASAAVKVVPKIILLATSVEPRNVSRGSSLSITCEVESSENVPQGIWLGASFRDEKTGKLFHDTSEDKPVSLVKGRKEYARALTIAKDAPLGEQKLSTSLWRGTAGDSTRSKWIVGARPISITIQ